MFYGTETILKSEENTGTVDILSYKDHLYEESSNRDINEYHIYLYKSK